MPTWPNTGQSLGPRLLFIRASRFDAELVLVTAFAAVFISVDESILVGVGFPS